jgi:hypothetical protein
LISGVGASPGGIFRYLELMASNFGYKDYTIEILFDVMEQVRGPRTCGEVETLLRDCLPEYWFQQRQSDGATIVRFGDPYIIRQRCKTRLWGYTFPPRMNEIMEAAVSRMETRRCSLVEQFEEQEMVQIVRELNGISSIWFQF